MMILLSKGIYTGSPESIQELFATGRNADKLETPRHDLPDSPMPDNSPEDFALTINARWMANGPHQGFEQRAHNPERGRR